MATDRYLLSMLETVEKFGFGLVHVGETCSEPGCDAHDEGPPFTYTVGLTAMGHPELLVHGLRGRDSGPLLNDLGERIKVGESFHHGQVLTCEHGEARLALAQVVDHSDLVVVGQVYPEVDALQVVWQDWSKRFPWDPGYNHWRFPQLLACSPPPAVAHSPGLRIRPA